MIALKTLAALAAVAMALAGCEEAIEQAPERERTAPADERPATPEPAPEPPPKPEPVEPAAPEPAPVVPAVHTGTLVITSDPPGQRVVIGSVVSSGRYRLASSTQTITTPATLEVPEGTHTLTVGGERGLVTVERDKTVETHVQDNGQPGDTWPYFPVLMADQTCTEGVEVDPMRLPDVQFGGGDHHGGSSAVLTLEGLPDGLSIRHATTPHPDPCSCCSDAEGNNCCCVLDAWFYIGGTPEAGTAGSYMVTYKAEESQDHQDGDWAQSVFHMAVLMP